MPNEQIWYASQSQLNKCRQETDIIVLSRDVPPGDGPKAFTWFRSYERLITFLESTKTNNPHYYELIVDTENYPTFMYFDIDRDIIAERDMDLISDIETSRDTLITTFLKKLSKFLTSYHNIDIILEIGKNTQISYTEYTDTNTKLSAHIKISIKFPNTKEHKIFSKNLDKYIRSNLYTTDEEREILMFYKTNKDGERHHQTVVDQSGYGKFKSFRILYSSKLKRGGKPLIPYKSSSIYIKDHLIQDYNHDNNYPLLNTNIPLFIDADYNTQTTFKFFKVENTTNPPHSKGNDITTIIPKDLINEIENFLKNTPILKCSLKFRDVVHINTHMIRYVIEKSCNHICPLANRVHRHNTSYFTYNYETHTLRYGCFNENCVKVPTSIYWKVRTPKDALKLLSLDNNHLRTRITLHCCKNIIKWNEEYNATEMRPYPQVPLLVIRAGMGVGKTKELNTHYIPENCILPKTKCLFITYQQVLAKKYASELSRYGFVNYLDLRSEYNITYNKVIICLDSLWRVQVTNFDYIFVDEALSVLLHFNSQYIKSSNMLCLQFEYLLLQAKHIIFLDAAIDNFMTYDLIEYLAQKRNISPYYIQNTHIRIPEIITQRRQAKLILNTEGKQTSAFKIRIFKHVVSLLKTKQKLVVSSSTKSFTEELHKYITSHSHDIRMMVYNRDNSNDITTNDWKNLDILIYSPTISAGISFEELHFDELISFIENSFYTPPIDIVLQQLFRVRALNTGQMTLFVNNTSKYDEDNYPILAHDIDAFLYTDVYNINKHFPQTTINFEASLISGRTGIFYDTDKMSYKLLRGILMNRNKSLLTFEEILVNTLKEDYGIPTEKFNFREGKGFIIDSIDLLKQIRKQLTKNAILYRDVKDTNEAKYKELEQAENRGEKLKDIDKQRKWYYKCCTELWKVDMKNVDIEFYTDYIGQCFDKEVTNIYKIYYKTRRYRELITSNDATSMSKFIEKMEQIRDSHEYNIDLYKTKIKEYYNMLIEGQRLMGFLFKNKEWKNVWTDSQNQELTISKEDFHKEVRNYIKSMSDTDYKIVLSTFEMDKKYSDRTKLMKDDKLATWFCKGILSKAFGINVESPEKDTDKTSYGERIFIPEYKSMIDKYQPYIDEIEFKDCIIFDDDYFDSPDNLG